MKLGARLKKTLLLTLILLYGTGAAVWVFNTFLRKDHGFGLETPPSATTILHAHSILGLWFLLLFGYLFRSHIESAWRTRKKRKSGILLTTTFVVLFLTVPGLFYLTGEKERATVSFLHTYLGLLSALPFLLHYFGKKAHK